jgi:hypothetical protein
MINQILIAMKTLIYNSMLALMLIMSSTLRAQNRSAEYLGLPGDNLNLFAVLNIFQESETLEGFERKLNDPDLMINNLDLNMDNKVDYIMVFDYSEGNLHNIVLRVALNQNEKQDVAVFIVERYDDGSVLIQLIGDEALYGPNYIIEPNYAETPNPGYRGNTSYGSSDVVTTTYYEVATWPVIVYLYEPFYVAWHSSWYWGFYPPYWYPWSPFYWHYYYGYHYHWHSHYYAYYRPWRHHRCHCYHNVYYTRIRNYSPTVIVNISNSVYASTYSRPEKRVEGERLFAEKHPNGTNNLSNRISKDSQRVNQSSQQKPGEKQIKEIGVAKPSAESKRPIKEPIQATGTSQGKMEAESTQREESSKPKQVAPAVQSRPSSQPKEPSRQSSGSNTGPSSSSSKRSESSKGSSSFGSSSNKSSGSSSSGSSHSVGSSGSKSSGSSSSGGSRQSSSSGSSSSKSNSGSSSSSKSQNKESSSTPKRR